jgi:hypothetical protein
LTVRSQNLRVMAESRSRFICKFQVVIQFFSRIVRSTRATRRSSKRRLRVFDFLQLQPRSCVASFCRVKTRPRIYDRSLRAEFACLKCRRCIRGRFPRRWRVSRADPSDFSCYAGDLNGGRPPKTVTSQDRWRSNRRLTTPSFPVFTHAVR